MTQIFGVLLCGALALAGSVRSLAQEVPKGFSVPAVANARGIPFKQVVEATTHFRVLDFDTNNPAHVKLRATILKAAGLAGTKMAQEGIETARPNEAGNHVEGFVRAALRDAGLPARVPVTSAGVAQSAGYPDIEIAGATPCYLELKTYNAATADSTQRTFYFSPSEHPKITRDALHFLLAYQLEKVSRDGKSVFVPVHWKLITLENLRVDMKVEFNQSNRGLYGADAAGSMLSEGDVPALGHSLQPRMGANQHE